MIKHLRALIEVAGGMVDAVSGQERLARSLAVTLADQVQVTATVWLAPAGGGPMVAEVVGHDPARRDALAARVQDLSGNPDPSLLAGQPLLVGEGIIVPIAASGRLIGAVAVSRGPDEADFDEADLGLIQALADMAAVTLGNARLPADSAAVMEDLRRQNEVIDHISDALIACDSDGRIVSWNSGAESIYGYPRAEALGCDLFALLATHFHSGDGQPLAASDVLGIAASAGGWRGEVRERRADGLPVTVLSSLDVSLDTEGRTRGLVLVNRDITEQRREEHRALHDALTGLPNRRMLVNRLYDAFARACRNGTRLAVVFLDLRQFALVNDRYGRSAGDEALRTVAHRLGAVLRDSDTVARLQDDRFVIVLEKSGTDENIAMVADRMARVVGEPIRLGPDALVELRATIGAVLVEGADGLDTTPEKLIDAANGARHMARAAGVDYLLERLAPVPA